MRDMINSECSKCCPLVLTKAPSRLLHWLVYCLVNNGLFRVSPDFHYAVAVSGTCHVYWLFAAQALYSAVLRYGLTGSQKSSEMKSVFLDARTRLSDVHCGPVRHWRTGLLLICVTLLTKNTVLIKTEHAKWH